jgi:hypothetical protein
MDEVRLYVRVFLSPFIPGIASLLDHFEVLYVWHKSPREYVLKVA